MQRRQVGEVARYPVKFNNLYLYLYLFLHLFLYSYFYLESMNSLCRRCKRFTRKAYMLCDIDECCEIIAIIGGFGRSRYLSRHWRFIDIPFQGQVMRSALVNRP